MTATTPAPRDSAMEGPAPVGWGFLGAGHIATANLGPAVRSVATAELRAAAGRTPHRTAALGATSSSTDYAAVLTDESVDIVYIALHNSVHADWTVRALRAGKHVLCEKPLGVSAAEVRAMIEAAAAADRLLVEATWNRWHPRTRDLAGLLHQGVLGEIQHVEAAFDGAEPDVRNYRRHATLGGGALLDVGCYAVGAILAAYDWAIPEITAVRRQSWPGSAADVRTAADLRFGESTANVVASLTGTGREVLKLSGTAGTVRLDSPFTAGRGHVELQVESRQGLAVRQYEPVDPYALMVTEMTRAVAGDKAAFLVPLDQSLAVAETLDAIRAFQIE